MSRNALSSMCRPTSAVAVALALALATVLSACRAPSPANTARDPIVDATAGSADRPSLVPRTPYDGVVAVMNARGVVEMRRGTGAWTAVAKGRALRGVSQIRVRGGAAVVAFARGDDSADACGKMWMRAGADVRIGRAHGQRLRVAVRRGETRLSLWCDGFGADLVRGPALIDVTAHDVVLRRHTRETMLLVASTTQRPALADWTLALDAATADRAGIGELAARTTTGDPANIELRQVHVRVRRVAGDVAQTEVEHVFFNPSDAQLEGTFRFPMPAQASLLSLAMEIDGRLMEGELVEREKARKTYEAIVESMRDPALLEWQQGDMLKLRVFPIAPRSRKRVVLRYVAPLRRAGAGLDYVYETAAPAMQNQLARFSIAVDGKTSVDKKDFEPGQAFIVPVARVSAAAAVAQTRADGTYVAARITPALIAKKARSGRTPRDLLLVVDTSRSSLEGRPLALQAIEAMVADLRARDRFLVVAADVTARSHATGFVAASDAAAAKALAFIRDIEPDGASDFGAAMRHAGEQLARTDSKQRAVQIVYVGDGTPTWGETAPDALHRAAQIALGTHPLHALVLGRGANRTFLANLTSRMGGRSELPRTRVDVRRFALFLRGVAGAPRVRNVTLAAGESDVIYAGAPSTLFAGDDLVAFVRTPENKTPPRALTLRGTIDGRAVSETITLGVAAKAPHVAHRWARHHLAHLQSSGATKETIVEQSLRYQVMSRHTSFLVLESEEAYKRHKIARTRGPEAKLAQAPKVSGRDLESTGARQARLSPDRVQPGDPEVRVPAPADARRVVVVFPFGETKIARYEPALRAWTVRFLIDKATPDGTYEVVVRVTHRDGRVQVIKLGYTVDTQRPAVALVVKRRRGGGYRFVVRQTAPRSSCAPATASCERRARIVEDLKRVDIAAPDGQVVALTPIADGSFVGRWQPVRRPTAAVVFRIVAADVAQNRSIVEATYDPRRRTVTSTVVR